MAAMARRWRGDGGDAMDQLDAMARDALHVRTSRYLLPTTSLVGRPT